MLCCCSPDDRQTLQSTVNEFVMLANRQFFEIRVYDDEEDQLPGEPRGVQGV
jgi:hypothetical protein